MQRSLTAIVLVCSTLALLPRAAKAGGPEFPGGGTRSLGRGAAAFARADDPSVMVRNPALLADLWDDQALFGAHLLLPRSCVQPTGAYGLAVSGQPDVSDFGNGPVTLNPPLGATDVNGEKLGNYALEPYPEVCYQGPAPFLPQVALSMKLSPTVGVGLGFFPPDIADLNQWGHRNGTVDTPNGLRPNPIRYEGGAGSGLSTSFFSLLSAAGWRPADWIAVGAGFQWNMVIYEARSWTAFNPNQLDPHTDIRTDVFGRDLFIPGAVASVQVRPLDNVDVALGFRWSDHLRNNAKLDITPGAFSTGERYPYLTSGGDMQYLGTFIPQTSNNQPVYIEAPPIWMPQLSLGVRFADRLEPRPKDLTLAHEVAKGQVQDHMLTERWDLELDAVYYFTTQYDETSLATSNDTVRIPTVAPDGSILPSSPFAVGRCPVPLVAGECQAPHRILKYNYHGKNQLSIRLGGDYNVLPGLLALRAGASYETAGQDVEYAMVMHYLMQRVGVHAGFSVRVADKTDISFGFAHFFQKDIHLQVNDLQAKYPDRFKSDEYHFEPGLGVADAMGNNKNVKGDFDGIAKVEVPNAAASRTTSEYGPNYVNAGRSYYHLDVLSLTFTQHF